MQNSQKKDPTPPMMLSDGEGRAPPMMLSNTGGVLPHPCLVTAGGGGGAQGEE